MNLTIDSTFWNEVIGHLLPATMDVENACFLFGKHEPQNCAIRTIGLHICKPCDFISQAADYLELGDQTRAMLLKRAHDQGACLVELHSHPFCMHAQFSRTDISGLQETVPHMLWRLRGQPYAAIVVARRSFDALVWATGEPRGAQCLSSIAIGSRILKPTNSSIGMWQ